MPQENQQPPVKQSYFRKTNLKTRGLSAALVRCQTNDPGIPTKGVIQKEGLTLVFYYGFIVEVNKLD